MGWGWGRSLECSGLGHSPGICASHGHLTDTFVLIDKYAGIQLKELAPGSDAKGHVDAQGQILLNSSGRCHPLPQLTNCSCFFNTSFRMARQVDALSHRFAGPHLCTPLLHTYEHVHIHT